ncbi:MAG TPA: sterol desaturase family protein [Vitreimonas sp.]|nr:sterol desaturase family protein [Vitreimonas sp.]
MTWAADAANALWAAFSALLWPAIVFAAVALAARGFASLRTARAASGEVRTNMILLAVDAALIAPLLALMVAAVGAWMQANGWRLFSAQHWSTPPAWLVLFIAVFAGDFIGYWRHRFEHTALLWPTHAIHHSDTAMTWTTLFRFHPLNRLTTAFIDTSALALLGLPPWALAANLMIRHYYGMFIHMDLPWTYGPLGRLLVSPVMHRWHHIRDSNGAGVNFATVFSVFDQAFRTYHVPGPCTVPLGVRDDIGQGALAQLVWPLKQIWRAVAPAPETHPARPR